MRTPEEAETERVRHDTEREDRSSMKGKRFKGIRRWWRKHVIGIPNEVMEGQGIVEPGDPPGTWRDAKTGE